jgi:hypothetical protein
MKQAQHRFSEETKLALAALRRAGRKASELSIRTGTPFFIWKDGKVVDLNANGNSEKKRPRPGK